MKMNTITKKSNTRENDKIPSFGLETPDGKVIVDPERQTIKILPSKGRRVYLTGAQGRLMVDFITMAMMMVDNTPEPYTENAAAASDGLHYFS